MNLQTLIPLALRISIMLILIALGLNANVRDAAYLFRRPGNLVRSLLAMNLLVPIFAVALALMFDLIPVVKIALVALSLSPVPPVLPHKAVKAGGTASYTIGLLVAASLFSIVFIPLVLALFKKILSFQSRVTVASIALIVATTILAPLVAGIVVNSLAPSVGAKLAKPISTVGTVVLVLAAIPVLITLFPAIISLIGNGTILAFAAFVLVALAVGHFLGGPDPDDRTVLALASASRHPAVAIAIAHANFPDEKLAVPAVFMYLLVSGIVTVPYIVWTKKHHASVVGAANT